MSSLAVQQEYALGHTVCAISSGAALSATPAPGSAGVTCPQPATPSIADTAAPAAADQRMRPLLPGFRRMQDLAFSTRLAVGRLVRGSMQAQFQAENPLFRAVFNRRGA